MKRKHAFSPARAMMKLLCLILGLILAGMLAITAVFQSLLGQIQYTQPQMENSPSSPQEVTVPELSTPSEHLSNFLDAGDVNWEQLRSDLTEKERSILNILLIGQDRREDETRTRADSILLCTFNKSTGQLTMTSFLRDLYVPIPGHGKDRINSAYAYGGMSLLKETLVENFGVHIDGTIEVDFTRFAGVVDALGGVTIQLRQDEAEVINRETGSSLTEGPQLLTGQQALAYSRIRSLDLDGDFSRTSRQRQVLTALVDSYKDAGFSTLLASVREVLPMLTTDMTEPRLLMLALELFPMLSDIQIVSQHIPAAGTYTDETINGMAVLAADLEAARELLRQTTTEN